MKTIWDWAGAVVVAVALSVLAACDADVKVDVSPDDSTGIIDDSVVSNDRDTVIVPGDTISVPDRGDDTSVAPRDTAQPTGNIRVAIPRAGDLITSWRFTLSGESRTFENTGNYRLRSADGAILAEGFFMATGEMGKFSPYSTTVEIKRAYTGNAMLDVFESSAKDGSEINMVHVPLRIRVASPTATSSLQVYFTNSQKNPGAVDCAVVFAVRRSVASTSAIARAAIEQLLRGPTVDERRNSFATEIPTGTRLKDIVINNGLAEVDFSREMNSAAGSCRVTAIRAQVERTLRQFPTVRRVVISVEGDSQGALQP